MIINSIDGKTLKKMFLAGAKSLEAKKEWINELNVFPVPDGDTGTNMTLTIMAAAKEVSMIDDKDATLEALAKAISSGSLRGARGNSGVILSQLFRGFTKKIKDKDVIDTKTLAEAAERAVVTAYKAVMKPKEGTILTVAKGMADKATDMAEETEDIAIMIAEVIKYGDEVLAKTPDMLPVLKQAGVVDSGGQGLMEVVRGAYDVFMGKELDLSIEGVMKPILTSVQADIDIKFGYCTEFIVLLEKEYTNKDELGFKSYLESIGDSIVVVSDDDIVKVHVHTNDPGLAIQKALSFGSLTSMKIDNMREEHQEKVIKDASKKAALEKLKESKAEQSKKEVGFIAVSVGEGINEIFKGLGVDYIIEGGQTMNPSTEDVLNAIEEVNANTIFVLPNNKNIVLAANQAQSLTKDKKIIVIPSSTVPQGISAVINYIPDISAEENETNMNEALKLVKTGQITYAVRDTVIEDKEIKEGNIMGIGDAGILSVGEEIANTTVDLIKELVNEDSELISIYYGEGVSEDDANAIATELEEEYADLDIEINYGGQPVYYYLLSVE